MRVCVCINHVLRITVIMFINLTAGQNHLLIRLDFSLLGGMLKVTIATIGINFAVMTRG